MHFKDGIYTVSGKVTLTTQGKDEPFGDQPIIGVPVKIQIFNMHAIAIDIDKNKVNNHFGNLPSIWNSDLTIVYGFGIMLQTNAIIIS